MTKIKKKILTISNAGKDVKQLQLLYIDVRNTE